MDNMLYLLGLGIAIVLIAAVFSDFRDILIAVICGFALMAIAAWRIVCGSLKFVASRLHSAKN